MVSVRRPLDFHRISVKCPLDVTGMQYAGSGKHAVARNKPKAAYGMRGARNGCIRRHAIC